MSEAARNFPLPNPEEVAREREESKNLAMAAQEATAHAEYVAAKIARLSVTYRRRTLIRRRFTNGA